VTASRLEPDAPAWDVRRLGRTLCVSWSSACLVLLVLLIGVRWLRYTSWSAAPGLDALLGELMVIDGQLFLWPWVYSRLYTRVAVVVLVVLVLGFHRRLREHVLRRENGLWRLTPIATAVLLGTMLWFHYAFDANPTVAAVSAASLVLVWLLEHPRVAATLPAGAPLGVMAVFFLFALVVAEDAADRVTIAAWAAFVLATHRWLVGRVRTGDLVLVRVTAVMPANVFATVLPAFVALHGGTHLGDGLAYSFCEVPGRGTVYASIPVCDSVRAGYEDCRDGRVVEYDLRTMQVSAEHRFFSPDFHGRLELLVCMNDEVHVAVQASVYRGVPLVQSAMAFSVANPADFVPVVAGKKIGTTIAYDEKHDAIFYSGEFTNRVVRYDRRTHRFDDSASGDFVRRWFEPVTLEEHTGSLILHTTSVHPGRNRIYLADWMAGRWAYALDLATLRLVARYDVGGGGAIGVSVDPERDRLFVSSLWGLEVIDLATDRIVARKRIGLGNRPVVVDAARNRLYVSSMVEGRIRILDRDTLDVVGQIPIGMGSRYPHPSRDGKWLFASSTAAHYYWAADELVR
jgi:hypothetical protein